jgi:hypothetical protein
MGAMRMARRAGIEHAASATQHKQYANAHQCPRIVRPHVIEHSGHPPWERHGRTDADDCAGKRQQKSSPGYKPHQFASLRTKGHANTQLAGTPRHFVRGIFNSWRNYDSIL